jgi:serine/threonine protein kinase/tetratricopeptide (TPR) repeat protein
MELPATFGKYQLLERIATGGMAEVFLARSFGVEGFEKHLVIKRILPQLARSPHFVQLFVREAKISSMLQHPNIIQVFDLGRVDDDHYIAMEHIHGRDLTRLVRRLRASGRGVPLPVAIYVAAEVARGLAHAHTRLDARGHPSPIVHRDISPHNVILSFQGEVKLVDFGIARLASELEAAGPSGAPGGGKFAYMSPEQARGERVDHRTDLFSAGIVLYELLVGHRLFRADDPDEKIKLVRDAVVPDPRIENPDIPDRLWEILQRTLARDLDDRYHSASDLEEDLRALLFDLGVRVDSPALGAFLREVFHDELGPDLASAQLQSLAAELTRLEADDPPSGTTTASDVDALSTGGTPRVVGEKKAVAVLVAELVGLTDASATMEPEDVLKQQDALLKAVRRVAERYNGWVDRLFAHDTLTILFGVPRAHEDDLDRSLACALDLLRQMGRLRKRGYPMDLAIGVHRGEVALTGTEARLRYIPRGNTVKLARRLASLAEPGEVFASDAVASQAGERWRFDVGPRVRMKGKREELATFVLAGRRRRALLGPGGRWIRRSDELEQLATAITGLAEGRGGLVAITGAAGTGKSRLLRQLRGLSRRARVSLFSARALPYGADQPLAPFRDLVASALGIELDDSPAEMRERLGRLGELGLSDVDAGHISGLFGVDAGGRALEPHREDIFAAGARFVRGMSADQPVLLALEDLQFLKPLERDLLAHLVRSSAGSRVLWLVTSRGRLPDELPPPSNHVQLGILGPEQQRALILDVLSARDVEQGLVDLVQKTARGNPLYVVEVVKALQEKTWVSFEGRRAQLRDGERAVPLLPPTLEGLVTARVDALDPATKGALQIAATIGLTFSSLLVAEAAGIDEPGPLFADLLEAGLVVGEQGEGPLTFASELVWQVVRRSILGVQLRDHHRMVAEGMERLYAEGLEPHYDALAGHCAASGRYADAAWYANKAGDLHRGGAFLEQSLAAYKRGVSWIQSAVGAGDDPELHARGEAALHMKAGEVALLLGNMKPAERHLVIALDLASDAVLKDVEGRCLLVLGRLYGATGRPSLARANLEQALGEARRTRDEAMRVQALTALGALCSAEGDFAATETLLDEALELTTDPSLAAAARLGLANRYIRDDMPERAWQQLTLARGLAASANDRILLGRIANNEGIALHSLGQYDRALAKFREALEVRRDTGYQQGLVINLHNIGDAYLRLGQPGKAHAAFSESRDLAREAGLERSVALNQVYLGYLNATRGEDGGLAELRAASREAERLGDTETLCAAGWLEGRLLASQGSAVAARAVLELALERAVAVGARWIARDIEAALL